MSPNRSTPAAAITGPLARVHPPEDPEPRDNAASEGFAVVELFTSEGCNSCPSADELLSEIAAEARDKSQPVYALGFHVDYWDDLGWVDRFASRANTDRQYRYAKEFRSHQIYTPQMIINGAAEFVGSDGRRARKTIASALKDDPTAISLALAAEGDFGLEPRVTVTYEVDRPAAGAVVNIAVTERGLESDVVRGENVGRHLHHDNVVRAFKTVPLEVSPGRVVVDIPIDLVGARSSVVAYVQDDRSMRILGAAGVDLSDQWEPPREQPAATSP